MIRPNYRNSLVLVIWLIVCAPVVNAATISVMQDGTGDFTVIQDAVDVADEGDVIDIGPGWYTEYGTYNNGFGWFDIHVYVRTDHLTFTGAGPAQTIIGPHDIGDLENEAYGMGHNDHFTWSVSGVKFINLNNLGVYHHFGYLAVDNCVFVDSENGINGQFSEGLNVQDCIFRNISDDAIDINSPSPEAVLFNNQFFQCWEGVRFDGGGCDGVQVSDCSFLGGFHGIGFYSGASGEIRNNSINGYEGYGIALSEPGRVEMTGNAIQSDIGWSCLYIASLGDLTVTNNLFSGGNRTLYFINAPLQNFHFHNNHILRDTGNFVLTPNSYQWDHRLNLTNNYWGTTDVEEISTYIIDGNDLPNSNLIVDFEPLADGPVSTEKTTLNNLKAMYR